MLVYSFSYYANIMKMKLVSAILFQLDCNGHFDRIAVQELWSVHWYVSGTLKKGGRGFCCSGLTNGSMQWPAVQDLRASFTGDVERLHRSVTSDMLHPETLTAILLSHLTERGGQHISTHVEKTMHRCVCTTTILSCTRCIPQCITKVANNQRSLTKQYIPSSFALTQENLDMMLNINYQLRYIFNDIEYQQTDDKKTFDHI